MAERLAAVSALQHPEPLLELREQEIILSARSATETGTAAPDSTAANIGGQIDCQNITERSGRGEP
jgi:hypothetical protein